MKRSLKHIIIAIVVVCCFASASHYFTQSQKTQASALTKNFSGEELYRGIFFFQGEAGKKINVEVAKQVEKAQSKPETKQFIDENIAYVKKQDPDYFKKLEQAIYIKDFVKVKQQIAQGSKYFQENMKSFNMEVQNSLDSSRQLVAGLLVVVYAGLIFTTVAGAAHLAYTVSVYVQVGIKHSKVTYYEGDNNSRFGFEKLINNVIENFN